MADFIFRVSPNIVLGEYTSSRLADYTKEGVRYIVVMDPVLKDAGVSDKLLTCLNDKGVNYFVMDEIGESAETKTIERALSLARDGHATGVIAIGGGKTMCIGCAVAALCSDSCGVYDCIDGTASVTSPVDLICLPTTIRDGLLFSPLIPVVDSRSHKARIIKTGDALCRLVLIDPNLSLSLTENQIASMTLEMLSLSIEAYLSQKATFFSDMLVEKTMELLRIVNNGTTVGAVASPATLRSQAGCMASLAAATSTAGLGTMLSLCMNAQFGVSRSVVSAILLPHIIEDALKFKADRMARIARLLGVAGDGSGDDTDASALLADDVRQQLAKAQLPMRLKDLSLTIEQLAPVVDNASALEMMTTLPRSMTADDIFELIKTAH